MATTPSCAAVELRQYRLHRGRRDELIALFEREFVEPQQAVGLHVLGTFCDLDDADRFVWWRGFDSLATRAESLAAFYDGPVWRRHRDAANATMMDSDDVHLLRPLSPLPPPGTAGAWQALIVRLPQAADDELIKLLGSAPGCWMVSVTTPNDYARLPVHQGMPVAVGLAAGRVEVPPPLQGLPLSRLNLQPTARSGWR